MTTGSPHAQGRDQRGVPRLGRPTSTRRTTCFGTVAGPHPFPAMVRDFQRVIGVEARAQVLERDRPAARRRRSPASAAAPTRSASSTAFVDDDGVRLIGFEAGGDGVETGRHAAHAHRRRARACCTAPAPTCCRTTTGQTIESHSISAGLDYPGVGPEHAWLARHRPRRRTGRSPTPRRWRRSRCSAAPRASSRRSSPRTPSPARCELGPRARAGRDDPGQPLRPRRQGRRHRGRAGSAWRGRRPDGRGRAASTRSGDGPTRAPCGRARHGAGRGPGRARRLPAGRLPDRRRLRSRR